MSEKRIELALKRQRLQLQAAAQRLRILRALESAGPAVGIADKAGAALRWARAHPAWLVGFGVALLVARPRAFVRWGRRGFVLWQMLRRARGALERFLPQRQKGANDHFSAEAQRPRG